jgi:plasmid stabilization system protein ParE
MTPPRLTASALDDLDEILIGVAEASGWERSMRIEEEIFAKIDRLAEFPGMGHQRPDLGPSNIFFTPVDPYLILYERDTYPITIHAILHGARDVRRILRGREF